MTNKLHGLSHTDYDNEIGYEESNKEDVKNVISVKLMKIILEAKELKMFEKDNENGCYQKTCGTNQPLATSIFK